MKVLIFKQPTFYKNQVGTRSQLCNPWNHRQKQLIQWKARAGWLARQTFKPTQGRHTGHRGYEEEQKLQLSSSSELSWERFQFASLSSAASCYNVRLFFFLHGFRNCESTPLWGHISQRRGHKKSGVTNDRKLIKNKKCDESWVLQAVTSLEPWLSTHIIHISDCICSSYDINKSWQTITSWTTELLLRIYQVVCPYRNDGLSMDNSWGLYYFPPVLCT